MEGKNSTHSQHNGSLWLSLLVLDVLEKKEKERQRKNVSMLVL